MTDTINRFEPDYDARQLRFGVVTSRFNGFFCDGLREACVAELLKQGAGERNIVLVSVPGALEIPLVLRKMAETGQFDALIALGAVIRGDTYHFEVVANESASGVSAVQRDTGIPVANGILTTNTDEEAMTRMIQKGQEAAQAAIEMANLLEKLDRIKQ